VKNRHQTRIELLQRTIDPLILRSLRRGPQHGYNLSHTIRANPGDIPRVDTWISFSRSAPYKGAGLALILMGHIGKQSPSQVLRTHPCRTPSA
jgi:hypothetical protein